MQCIILKKDTDINFETNEKVNLSKYISERLTEKILILIF